MMRPGLTSAWKFNIKIMTKKIDFKDMESIKLIQKNVQWRDFMETVTNIQVT